MPKIPPEELKRLKEEVNLLALVRSRGVELKKKGEDYHGLCPFHADKNPSMVVSPGKGLFNCFACDAGGTVIDWVMKAEGVSFKHAMELLREKEFSHLFSTEKKPKISTSPILKSPLSLDAQDQELLKQTITYYHSRLKETGPGTNEKAREYLRGRGLLDEKLITRYQIGFCDRSLCLRLEDRNRANGKVIREKLQALGVLRKSGHEHFRGSITIPILDEAGNIREVYGRKITQGLRKGTPLHTYLPGPHGGVFNASGLLETRKAAKENDPGLHPTSAILTESILDALSFIRHGFYQTTASFGIQGFTDEMLSFLIRHGFKKIYIAYDPDRAGNQAAGKLAQKLIPEGFECLRVRFPGKLDPNAFIQSQDHPKSALKALINAAEPIFPGDLQRDNSVQMNQQGTKLKDPSCARFINKPLTANKLSRQVTSKEKISVGESNPLAEDEASELPESVLATKEKRNEDWLALSLTNKEKETGEQKDFLPLDAIKSYAGHQENPEGEQAEPATKSHLPLAATTIPTEKRGEDIFITLGEREYRIRGLLKNLSFDVLRVNLKASKGDFFHVDTLDLYHARNRSTFIHVASKELGESEAVIKRDLGRILLKLEELQEKMIEEALKPKQAKEVELSDSERAEAMDFLKDPKLFERILKDFNTCGIVGERINVLVGYLAATSRLLERPLGVVIQSSSAAGKTSLMEAVLNFMPDERKVKYSAMTGQSLFYMGETDLKGKILAIVEEEGAEKASYALKLLQSEGELSIASTGKESKTGRMITHEYKVEGPTMVFLTSTAIDIDEEFLNRCVILSVNESREQTRAIHQRQRFSQTLEGLLSREKGEKLKRIHKNAQRLLRPLLVANPYARDLTFLSDKTRTRRDHLKYQYLIRSIALLNQYQRPIKRCTHDGMEREYIEVEIEDIRIANELAHEVLGRSLDELPPQTRKLLHLIFEMVQGICKKRSLEQDQVLFTRKEVREFTGWGNTQLKLHLSRLEDLEYLLVFKTKGARTFRYELLYKGEDERREKFVMGLLDPNELQRRQRESRILQYDDLKSGVTKERSVQSRPIIAPLSGDGRASLIPDLMQLISQIPEEITKISISPPEKLHSSYTLNHSDISHSKNENHSYFPLAATKEKEVLEKLIPLKKEQEATIYKESHISLAAKNLTQEKEDRKKL